MDRGSVAILMTLALLGFMALLAVSYSLRFRPAPKPGMPPESSPITSEVSERSQPVASPSIDPGLRYERSTPSRQPGTANWLLYTTPWCPSGLAGFRYPPELYVSYQANGYCTVHVTLAGGDPGDYAVITEALWDLEKLPSHANTELPLSIEEFASYLRTSNFEIEAGTVLSQEGIIIDEKKGIRQQVVPRGRTEAYTAVLLAHPSSGLFYSIHISRTGRLQSPSYDVTFAKLLGSVDLEP